MELDELSREDLVTLVKIYARSWLAHDGCWFLAAEERHGLQEAIALDSAAWARFAPTEARRIMEAFRIPHGGGLWSLSRALGYRLYATINRQECQPVDDHLMRFRMLECRVQATREQKGLPAFPCRSVGVVEYTEFARAVDPRIQTACMPHGPSVNAYAMEFVLPQ
jgi:hypothetical protein